MTRLGWRHSAAIAVLALTAYAPTLRTGFLWDDHVMIETNPALRQWSWQGLRRDLTTDVFDGHGDPYFRPAQTWLNRLDYTVWGLNPFGYHLTNLAAHVGNSLLTVSLGLALGLSPMGAFLAGTLFAVQPIGVEQLMIVAGRAELFSLLAGLLFLWLLRRPGVVALAPAYAALTASLLFKESGVVWPVAAALLFLWKGERGRRYWALLPAIPLIAAYLALRHAAVGAWPFPTSFADTAVFATTRFPHILVTYAGLLLVPWNLHSHRLVPATAADWPVYPLLALGAAVASYRLRQRWVLLSILWLVVCLLPKMPVMQYGRFMLDHWAYPAFVAGAWALGHRFAAAWQRPAQMSSKILIPGYLVLLVFWALLVHLNVALRGTDEKMYRWALRFTTSNPVHYNLGVELLRTGRPMEAADHFETVRHFYPDDARNLHALARAYWEAGYENSAYFLMKEAAARFPDEAPLQQSWASVQRVKASRPLRRKPSDR